MRECYSKKPFIVEVVQGASGKYYYLDEAQMYVFSERVRPLYQLRITPK